MSNPIPGANSQGAEGMVEVEIEGEKILVPEASKDKFKGGFLGQSDYSKNMAKLRTDREEFESTKNQYHEVSELGQATDELLNANPRNAEILRALAEDNSDELKRLVGAAGENTPPKAEDKLARLEAKIASMEEAAKVTRAQSQRAQSSGNALIQAKALAKETYGIEYDNELVQAMEKFKTHGNPHLVMFAAGDRERSVKSAREAGLKEGYEKAVNDMIRKSENTPPISSGSGNTGRSGKTGRGATEAAFAKLTEEGKI